MNKINHQDSLYNQSKRNSRNIISVSQLFDPTRILEQPNKLQHLDELYEFQENQLIALQDFLPWNNRKNVDEQPSLRVRNSNVLESLLSPAVASDVGRDETKNDID